MLFCKDCRHCRPDSFFAWVAGESRFKHSKCAALESREVNPVTGIEYRTLAYCSTARGRYGECGENGRLFEAREREAA